MPAPSALPAAPASVAAPAPAGPAKARFTCQPEACEWVACDGKNVAGIDAEVEIAPGKHDCSASKLGYGSKSLSFTATLGEVAAVTFELPALPTKAAAAAPPVAKPAAAAATKPASSPAKSAAPAASAKPAAPAKAATSAKGAALAKPIASAIPSKDAKAGASSKTKKKCSAFLGCK